MARLAPGDFVKIAHDTTAMKLLGWPVLDLEHGPIGDVGGLRFVLESVNDLGLIIAVVAAPAGVTSWESTNRVVDWAFVLSRSGCGWVEVVDLDSLTPNVSST